LAGGSLQFRPAAARKIEEARRSPGKSDAGGSAVDAQLHFERHRRESEVVSALEALGEVAVTAFLELEALQ